jgi:hypothetical protein
MGLDFASVWNCELSELAYRKRSTAEDYSPQPVWGEYQWERSLQEQEHRTDQYIRLVEMYRDHPNRDEIIAREMGWGHLDAEEERAWAEEVDALSSVRFF